MIRTRDFFLFVSIVVFLLVGIGSTVLRNQGSDDLKVPQFTEAEDEAVRSAAVGTKTVDRDTRLAIIREKIAAGATLYSQDSFFEADDVSTSSDEIPVAAAVQLCSDYAPYQGFWDLRQVSVMVEAGVRVATLETSVATTTVSEVLLRLPLSAVDQGEENCLSTDVIGITPAGALLRNNDAIFYRGVDDTVLLGYALDGYPIYGTGAVRTDTCGGVSMNGRYKYVLSADRDTMLNCFTGQPASL